MLPGEIELVGAFIPPGSFLMGATNEDEQPVHRVTLTTGFFLGVHPVTQAQWKAVMGTDPSNFQGPNRPVELVTWWDCLAFCEKLTTIQKTRLTIGLPTEAEWEYACRAGTTTEYHFGDVINPDLANYNGNHSWDGSPGGKQRAETTEVGSFSANAWGLYDMHGNVWEWCEDWADPYKDEDQTDPRRTETQFEDRKVLRGGGWTGNSGHCRAAYRNMFSPDTSASNYGFRVCFRME
jgi:formylglycine-generating enzyme required for sulfatase activity